MRRFLARVRKNICWQCLNNQHYACAGHCDCCIGVAHNRPNDEVI